MIWLGVGAAVYAIGAASSYALSRRGMGGHNSVGSELIIAGMWPLMAIFALVVLLALPFQPDISAWDKAS